MKIRKWWAAGAAAAEVAVSLSVVSAPSTPADAKGPNLTAFDIAINETGGANPPAGAIGANVASTVKIDIDAIGTAPSKAGFFEQIRTSTTAFETQTGPNNSAATAGTPMLSSAIGAIAASITFSIQTNQNLGPPGNIPATGNYAGYVPNCGDAYAATATRDYNGDGLLNSNDNMVTTSKSFQAYVGNMANENTAASLPDTPTGLFFFSTPMFVASEYGTDALPGVENDKFIQTYDDDNNNGKVDTTMADVSTTPEPYLPGEFTGNAHPLAAAGDGTAYFSGGVPQSQEDYDADGYPNGVEYMPDFLPVYADSLGIRGFWESRVYGIADVFSGLAAPTDVHLMGFSDVPGVGGLTLTVLVNPFSAPDPASQATAICSPFTITVSSAALTTSGPMCIATARTAGCPAPGGISTGASIQKVTATGLLSIKAFVSDTDDYDADGFVSPNDLCNITAGGEAAETGDILPGTDLADPDFDLTTGACDAANGSADNDGDGNGTLADRDLVIPITASCLGAGSVCDNDVDGDGWINNVDNCERTANPEQTDDDGDGVGDAVGCDGLVTIDFLSGLSAGKGSGANSPATFDNDLECIDAFDTAGSEEFGDGPGVGACTVVADVGDDGEFDAVDTDSDEDGDGFSDSLETALATNPLNPASFPSCITNPGGTATAPDLDGDHLLDSCEAGVGTTFGAPTALGTPGNSDFDGDGVKDGMEMAIGTNPTGGSGYASADTDGDSCSDAIERGLVSVLGGNRHPGNYWDFYDVDGTGSVGLADALKILAHFGHANVGIDGSGANMMDHQRLDRVSATGSNAYPPGFLIEADTGVGLGDALTNLSQFGASGCTVGATTIPAPGAGIYP